MNRLEELTEAYQGDGVRNMRAAWKDIMDRLGVLHEDMAAAYWPGASSEASEGVEVVAALEREIARVGPVVAEAIKYANWRREGGFGLVSSEILPLIQAVHEAKEGGSNE